MNKIKNTMYKSLAVLIGILIFGSVDAQIIELEQDVNADTVLSKFGKNRKHYVGSAIGFGIIPGQFDTDSVQLKSGESTRFTYSIYYKYRVSNFYSIVSSVNYGLSQFEFETPENVKYNRLNVNDVSLELSNRFNFGKRGNRIGNYLELGVSGDYVFRTKQDTKVLVDDPAVNHAKRRLILTGMTYVEKPNYSVHARIGFNKLVLTADYRLSDLTNDQINFDLPPLAIGVRLDLGA